MLFAMTGSENLAHLCPRSPRIRLKCLCSASEILRVGSSGGSSSQRRFLSDALQWFSLLPPIPPTPRWVSGSGSARDGQGERLPAPHPPPHPPATGRAAVLPSSKQPWLWIVLASALVSITAPVRLGSHTPRGSWRIRGQDTSQKHCFRSSSP